MTESLPQTPSVIAARKIRALRSARGWSVRELAERCRQVGLPLTENALENIERGRLGTARRGRDLTVDEVLQLAQVFDVPPLLLVVPLGEDDKVEVAPSRKIGSYRLWDWLTAEDRFVGQQPDTPERKSKWDEAMRPVTLYRQFTAAALPIMEADSAVRAARRIGEPEPLRAAETAYVGAIRAWAGAVKSMIAAGMTLPPHPPQWSVDARELGFLTDLSQEAAPWDT